MTGIMPYNKGSLYMASIWLLAVTNTELKGSSLKKLKGRPPPVKALGLPMALPIKEKPYLS
jgi:hypothetical protein